MYARTRSGRLRAYLWTFAAPLQQPPRTPAAGGEDQSNSERPRAIGKSNRKGEKGGKKSNPPWKIHARIGHLHALNYTHIHVCRRGWDGDGGRVERQWARSQVPQCGIYRNHRRHTEPLLTPNAPNHVRRALPGRPAPVVQAAPMLASLFQTASEVLGTEERAWQAACGARGRRRSVWQRGALRARKQLHGHQHYIHAHVCATCGGHALRTVTRTVCTAIADVGARRDRVGAGHAVPGAGLAAPPARHAPLPHGDAAHARDGRGHGDVAAAGQQDEARPGRRRQEPRARAGAGFWAPGVSGPRVVAQQQRADLQRE